MPEFGLNLQDDTYDAFYSNGNAFSFAQSRAFTPTPDILITEISLYGRLGSGNNWDLDFYLYEADVNGKPTNQLAGPFNYSGSGSTSVSEKITVSGLSVSVSSGTKICLVFLPNVNSIKLAHNNTTVTASLSDGSATDPWVETGTRGNDISLWAVYTESATTPTFRKSSTFDIETTLGTITTATLNSVNVFDHVTGQAGTTVSFAGAATDEITTSGEYSLVLGDGTGTETVTIQVNVFGVAPSNNPLQKDGAALASLTDVEVRVSAGANLSGSELYYSGTAITDASGNLDNIDLSSTNAADADPVLLSIRTAAGDSIVASETVGII